MNPTASAAWMRRLSGHAVLGWTSNERWRQMQESTPEPIGGVEIEYIDVSNIVLTRGKKEDVERVYGIISDIDKQQPSQ